MTQIDGSASGEPERVAARLPELRGAPLADQAHAAIRKAIFDGTFRPGQRLTIEALAGELGVSRTPVREALKLLEGHGLVELLPHRGVVVTGRASEEPHRFWIKAMILGYAIELALGRDVKSLTVAFQPICEEMAELAARPISDDDACARQFGAACRAFQDVISEHSGSDTVIRLLASLYPPVDMSTYTYRRPEERRATFADYQAVEDACRRLQPKLARDILENQIRTAGAASMSLRYDLDI
jgi:DNA-binding GntR family transcriptional regulator